MGRAAKSQLVALPKRLQSGVPVSREYRAAFASRRPVQPEPRDLELGAPAGLSADDTGEREILGRAHIHPLVGLYDGEVVSCQEPKKKG